MMRPWFFAASNQDLIVHDACTRQADMPIETWCRDDRTLQCWRCGETVVLEKAPHTYLDDEGGLVQSFFVPEGWSRGDAPWVCEIRDRYLEFLRNCAEEKQARTLKLLRDFRERFNVTEQDLDYACSAVTDAHWDNRDGTEALREDFPDWSEAKISAFLNAYWGGK